MWTEGQCRVLIVEKSRLAAEALMFALDSDPRINAIGYESDGWEAVELVGSYGPDVVLVGDVERLGPLQFTALVHDFFPETSAIVICEHDRPEDIEDAQSAGAARCVSAACSADELLHAITSMQLPNSTRRTDDLASHLQLAGAGVARV